MKKFKNAVLVGHSPLIFDEISAILEDLCGFNVFSFSGALNALEFIKIKPEVDEVDFIFTEADTPGIANIEFVKWARIYAPGAVIVGVTGSEIEKNAQKAFDWDHFIFKPFDLREIMSF